MKRGEPAIYRPLDPKPFPNYRANYNFRGMYNQRFVCLLWFCSYLLFYGYCKSFWNSQSIFYCNEYSPWAVCMELGKSGLQGIFKGITKEITGFQELVFTELWERCIGVGGTTFQSHSAVGADSPAASLTSSQADAELNYWLFLLVRIHCKCSKMSVYNL